MAENNRPVAEPLQKTAQTAQMVRGAIKTGKAIAGAAKGAAAGGPYGAAIGLVWGNRKLIGKIIIAVIAILMIPIMIICMLPSIIFGGFSDAFSPHDPDTPILNSSTVINDNLTDISTTVSAVLSESMSDTLAARYIIKTRLCSVFRLACSYIFLFSISVVIFSYKKPQQCLIFNN